MKSLFLYKILLPVTILISFFVSGCYTVIWTPEDKFPNDEHYDYDTGYYIDDYYYYYDYPWWFTITPPATEIKNDTYERDRNNNTSKIRNSGNGRRNEDPGRDVLNTPPPTVDKNSDKDTGTTNTGVRKPNNSGSTTSSNNSGHQSSGNSSNNVRNNNGSRNNGRGR